jgi:DNA uptake protein ComE-like DNA-binding protein
MKKNRPKEVSPLYETNAKGLINTTSENVLIYLCLATILLSLNVFHVNRNFLLQKFLPLPEGDFLKKFVWLSGSSDLAEGLYQFTQKQLQDRFPEIYDLRSQKSASVTTPLVSAIYIGDSKTERLILPPPVANIFFQPIPINQADEKILTLLPGIGPVLAEKIIQRRNLHGPFKSKKELLTIKGIGPKKYARLTEHITID